MATDPKTLKRLKALRKKYGLGEFSKGVPFRRGRATVVKAGKLNVGTASVPSRRMVVPWAL